MTNEKYLKLGNRLDSLLQSDVPESRNETQTFYIDDTEANIALTLYADAQHSEARHRVKLITATYHKNNLDGEKQIYARLLQSYGAATPQPNSIPRLLSALKPHTGSHKLDLLIITNLEAWLDPGGLCLPHPYELPNALKRIEEHLAPRIILLTMTPNAAHLLLHGKLRKSLLPLRPYARSYKEIQNHLFPPYPFDEPPPKYSEQEEFRLFELSTRYISSQLIPEDYGRKLSIRNALLTVDAFRKFCRRPQLLIDLQLHYVRSAIEALNATGANVTQHYVYNSITKIFEEAVKLVVRYELRDGYEDRCMQIQQLAGGIGYCLPDTLYDILRAHFNLHYQPSEIIEIR